MLRIYIYIYTRHTRVLRTRLLSVARICTLEREALTSTLYSLTMKSRRGESGGVSSRDKSQALGGVRGCSSAVRDAGFQRGSSRKGATARVPRQGGVGAWRQGPEQQVQHSARRRAPLQQMGRGFRASWGRGGPLQHGGSGGGEGRVQGRGPGRGVGQLATRIGFRIAAHSGQDLGFFTKIFRLKV